MMNRNFGIEFVRVTEMAAMASARWMGKGDEKAADHAAVEAMRSRLNSIEIDGTVVIGEGERDEAPMLYIGEKVGMTSTTSSHVKVDIALDPLEGTTICARGLNNSLSVMAIAEEGGFLHAPDVYMQKIAVGPEARGVIDLSLPPAVNLALIARAKGCSVSDLTVVILDRPRHSDLVSEVRTAGARIWLITDGDISAAIATCKADSGVDVLMGTGGAPEGVISAAALRCMGGDIQGKLIFRNDDEKGRAKKMGITNFDRIYKMTDLAQGNVHFCATGVTQGTLLNGVRFVKGGARTHSVVMRSESGTIRFIEAEHQFESKKAF